MMNMWYKILSKIKIVMKINSKLNRMMVMNLFKIIINQKKKKIKIKKMIDNIIYNL